MKKLQIDAQPNFWLTLSLALIFIPVPWLLSWFIAATLHEIFHLIALRLCGYSCNKLRIGATGASIESDIEPGIKMTLCALAGPISGFLLFPAVHIFPRIVICGFLQSLCNLLPIYPLDGSRIVSGVVFTIFKEKNPVKICIYIERIVMIMVTAIICYSVFRLDLGIVPLILIIVIFVKKKYLANHVAQRYNMNSKN